MRRWPVVWVWGYVGCATSTPTTVTPPIVAVPAMQLEGRVILASPDPLTQLDSYTPDELFALAQRLDDDGDTERAFAVYARLVTAFPDSRLLYAAQFNLGLLYEARQAWVEASASYAAIRASAQPVEPTDLQTWLDAHFRHAVCLGKLGEWWRSVAVFDAILAFAWLTDHERLEALAGRGIAIHETGDADSAEVALSAVLRWQREMEQRGAAERQGLAAEAAFRLGEIAAERYRQVELVFPVETLRARLEEKCTHLLSAQHRYLRALRFGDAHTAAAAGYRIGNLYESLYDAVSTLEAPRDLTSEQAEVYREEVYKRINVLVEKALKVYSRALEVGRAAPTAAPWIERLEQAIERLRRLSVDAAKVARTQPDGPVSPSHVAGAPARDLVGDSAG